MTSTSTRHSITDTPTANDVVDRIRQSSALIKKNAAAAESDRRVTEDTIDAIRDAGVSRIATPRSYGGYEFDLRSMLDVSAALAEADGGPAWVATLSIINAWVTALYSKETRDEVWANGPDTILTGVIAPTGTARKVNGGYRVSGKWAHSSASLHAEWAAGGVYLRDENDQILDQAMVTLPKQEFSIQDTWYVAGMRSSGSNSTVATTFSFPNTATCLSVR